ncbi:PepSY domain-containing protein [Mycobacterium sp. SMC-4]|uniref:PepSY domain-containing protein n=1 Tax=Mycobacterium sp. SMC-4 TaxID=2857059 RepID=UPI0021B1FA5E|nr:PepSY domain-containing protein [Mycobacterium sp. SMC-4]UXA16300.1 PepSY domain-containing protein [Mycobacterium sp. SMC-4]
MTPRSKSLAVISAASLALAVSGCGQGGDTPTESVVTETVTATAPAPAATTTETLPLPPTPGGPGLPVPAAQEALRTSAAVVPNGRPYDVQVETRDGQRVFEIEVASEGDEFEVIVDAAGTRILSSTRQDSPDDDARRAEAATVDAARALQTAADREPDTFLDELEIDADGAQLVWKVELVRADGSEVEVKVDAQDGSIR